MRKLILAGLVAVAVPGAALADRQPPKKLLAMSPDAFQAATTVQDDPLEFHATLSTQKAHREGWGLFRLDGHDNHLRAIVDKRTGATTYEVRTKVRYYGSQRAYRSAHFITPAGLQTAPLTLQLDAQDPCATNDNNNNFNCALTKTIAFELDEAAVRAIAAQYRPDRRHSWAFKLKDDNGADIRTAIVPAEAAGLLRAVDDYRASRPLQVAAPGGHHAMGMMAVTDGG
ncbi:hypothetical protein [Sphingomonas sp.]|uniref:hypothetical protein n=1 Tax=Sphingomonas sp. TaxID=28214 RepID=UPI003B3A9342